MGLAAFIREAKGDWQLLSLGQRLLAVCAFANTAVLLREVNSELIQVGES